MSGEATVGKLMPSDSPFPNLIFALSDLQIISGRKNLFVLNGLFDIVNGIELNRTSIILSKVLNSIC